MINSELKQHESLVPCFMQQILPTEYNIHSNITANNESTTTALLAKFVTQKVLGISTQQFETIRSNVLPRSWLMSSQNLL